MNPYESPALRSAQECETLPPERQRLGLIASIGLLLAFAMPLSLIPFMIMDFVFGDPGGNYQPWLFLFWVAAAAEPLSLVLCIYAATKSPLRVIRFGIGLAAVGTLFFFFALLQAAAT
jgi:hypothetical protein